MFLKSPRVLIFITPLILNTPTDPPHFTPWWPTVNLELLSRAVFNCQLHTPPDYLIETSHVVSFPSALTSLHPHPQWTASSALRLSHQTPGVTFSVPFSLILRSQPVTWTLRNSSKAPFLLTFSNPPASLLSCCQRDRSTRNAHLVRSCSYFKSFISSLTVFRVRSKPLSRARQKPPSWFAPCLLSSLSHHVPIPSESRLPEPSAAPWQTEIFQATLPAPLLMQVAPSRKFI